MWDEVEQKREDENQAMVNKETAFSFQQKTTSTSA